MVIIVRWLLYEAKYSCISSNMVDKCLLLQGYCCRLVSIVDSVSMVDKCLLLQGYCCRLVSIVDSGSMVDRWLLL